MAVFTEYEGGGFLAVDGVPVVEFDGIATINESLDTDATEHPIERGVDVLDTAVRQPLEVRFTAYVTATPLDVDANTPRDRDRIAWDALRSLWLAGSPVTFSTAGDTWENMRVVHVGRDRTPQSGAHMLTVSVELRQIFVATVETVEVPVQFIAPPVRASATAEVDAGRQPTGEADEGEAGAAAGRRRSMLSRIIGGGGE